MHATDNTASGSYTLPPEIQEFCEVARRIVRDELIPREQEWLSSPNHAYGMRELPAIRAVFNPEVAAHLDPDRRAALYDEICALGAQALMTGTEAGLFDSLGARGQCFALDDGQVGAL
jgi:hypothetical protein